MFRIQENKNGSTSVFCSKTGKLMCTIRTGAGINNAPKKINVVVPSSSQRVTLPSTLSAFKESESSRDNENTQENSSGKSCSSSPSPNDVCEESVDYSDECITQDEFARCLDLVPTSKFKKEPIEKIFAEFSLRLLSRSGAFRDSAEVDNLKALPDFVSVSSSLGQRILQSNKNRDYIDDQRTQSSIKRYEEFCRLSNMNEAKRLDPNFPKLRCRENLKSYPITFPSKYRDAATHIYSFGSRQRMERMRTITSGLSPRSRMFLQQCVPCSTRISPLKNEVITEWTTPPRPCTAYGCSHGEQEITVIKEYIRNPAVSSFNYTSKHKSEISTHSASAGENLKEFGEKLPRIKPVVRYQSKRQMQLYAMKCKVKLENILNYIHEKSDGKYYVKNTSITVPFYSDNKIIKPSLKHRLSGDHTYHCQTLRTLPLKLRRPKPNVISEITLDDDETDENSFPVSQNLSNCTENKGPFEICFRSKPLILESPKKFSLLGALKEKSSSPSKHYPQLWNLLNNHHEEKGESSKELFSNEASEHNQENSKYLVSQWNFHCFGCGFKQVFHSKKLHFAICPDVKLAIKLHLNKYHSVMEPESFLTSYLDDRNRCAVIEAFHTGKNLAHES